MLKESMARGGIKRKLKNKDYVDKQFLNELK